MSSDINKTISNGIPPGDEFIWQHVQPFRQCYSWDCGLTCIQMLLPPGDALYIRKNLQSIGAEEGFHESTWTIDLCYLLRKHNIPHIFYTRTLGAQNEYKNDAFYAHVYEKDECRVNTRFKRAEVNGVDVRQMALSLDAVFKCLSDGPAIVLTNAWLLVCDTCGRRQRIIDSDTRSSGCYSGHYIVLCGFSAKRRMVFYRNPTVDDHQCLMSFQQFEEARKAFGTDEDIIFIKVSNLS